MSAITRFWVKRIERIGIKELDRVPPIFKEDVEKALNKIDDVEDNKNSEPQEIEKEELEGNFEIK